MNSCDIDMGQIQTSEEILKSTLDMFGSVILLFNENGNIKNQSREMIFNKDLMNELIRNIKQELNMYALLSQESSGLKLYA
jgi:hypothetical protein